LLGDSFVLEVDGLQLGAEALGFLEDVGCLGLGGRDLGVQGIDYALLFLHLLKLEVELGFVVERLRGQGGELLVKVGDLLVVVQTLIC
jgi:hypothetical protein